MGILLLKVVLQFLAVAIAVLVNLLDYVSHDKRTIKFKRRRTLLFVLSTVFLILSIGVTVEDEFAKQEEISSLKQQGETTKNLLTGGSSYCYLGFGGDGNIMSVTLVHEGDYPLYDLNIRVVDLDLFRSIVRNSPNLTTEDISRSQVIYEKTTLGPNQALTLGTFHLPPDVDRKAYNVFILARNGWFQQFLRFRRVSGVWRQAFKVEKFDTKSSYLLKESIEEGFPRNGKGTIDWEK